MQYEQCICFGALAAGLCASGCILKIDIEDVQLPASRANSLCSFTEISFHGALRMLIWCKSLVCQSGQAMYIHMCSSNG